MSRLRIVAGTYGGRRIDAPQGRGVRPTREKVREAWFSALGPELAGTRVADLFAGSGALGLEALSRGAAFVHFVESDRRAAAVLASNVDALEAGDRAEIVRRDVASFLDGREGRSPFDLALADPPYGSGWPRRLTERLRRTAFARLLCVEHQPGVLDGTEGTVWSRRYGDSALTFVRPPPPGDDAGGPGNGGAASAPGGGAGPSSRDGEPTPEGETHR